MSDLDETELESQTMIKKEVDEPPIHERVYPGYFGGDFTRLVLLVILYIIQGVSFGFLMGTLPIMLKKHFSYTEIGIISFCAIPYSIKFLFSPIVDTKYIKCIGRRRTWIIPGQVIAAILLYCIGDMYEDLSKNRRLYAILFMFTLVFTALAFQDIAVDGWAVTIVRKQNLANSASCQLLGLSTGYFLGMSVYLAFNSVDFCNKYIYFKPSTEPLLNVQNFLKSWSLLILIVTLYVALFQNEKYDRQKVDTNDEVTSIGEMVTITVGILKNKNMRSYLFFVAMTYATCSFSSLIGNTFLLDELKYKQEKLSFIDMINFPIGVVTSIFIGKYIYELPLNRVYTCRIFVIVCEMVIINILFYNFTSLKGLKFDMCLLLMTLASNFGHKIITTSRLCFANKTSNISIASTQITLFNSLGNLMSYIPNIYSYVIVDYCGLYWPNLIGCTAAIFILVSLKPRVDHLETVPKDEWIDSDRFKTKI